jgi:hypothetical protein
VTVDENKTVENIEGFLRWAARHEMSIYFERYHYGVTMTCHSRVVDFRFAHTFNKHDFQMNMPFSRILLSKIIDFEKTIFKHETEKAKDADE